MIPHHIKATLAVLSKSYTIERGVSSELIAEAEQSLGFLLPADVRAFAAEVGAIHRASDSFSILFPGNSLVEGQGESAYQSTLNFRQSENLPPQILVLDGRDYPLICLDASDLARGVFTFNDQRIGRKVAPDFFSYLAEWINVRIEDVDEKD